MFSDELQRLKEYKDRLSKKNAEKAKINGMQNLLELLERRNLMNSSDEAQEIAAAIRETLSALTIVMQNDSFKSSDLKAYLESYNELVTLVGKHFDLVPSGSIGGKYMATGLLFGIVFGVVFTSTGGPAMLSVGMGVGVAVGLAVGASKEEKAKKADRVF